MSDTSGSDLPQGMDIASLMKGFGAASDMITDSISNLGKTVQEGQQATASKKIGILEAGQGEAMVSDAQQQAAIKQKRDINVYASMLGNNPDQMSGNLVIAANSITGDEKDIMDMNDVINKKRSVGFLDDPLQWMTNQFSLPFDTAARDEKVQQQQQKIQTLNNLSILTQEDAKALASIDASASEGQLAGARMKALGTAQANAAQSDFDMARLGIDAINVRANIGEEQFRNMVQVHSSIMEEQNLKINEDKLTIERQQVEQQGTYYKSYSDLHDIEMRARQDDLQAQQLYTNKINGALATIGAAPTTYNEIKLMSTQTRNQLEELASDPNVSSGHLGWNTADALDKSNIANWPLTPGMNITRQQLINAVAPQIKAAEDATPGGKLAPDVRNRIMQTAIQDYAKSQATMIPKKDGLYSPPPMLATLTTDTVKNLPFVTKYLAPLANADPTAPTDPDVILKSAFLAIQKGDETPQSAAMQIQRIFQAANLDNFSQHQYNRWQLPQPTTSFPMQFNNSGWNTSTVDMLSTSNIQNVLTRMIIRQNMEPQPGPGQKTTPEGLEILKARGGQ